MSEIIYLPTCLSPENICHIYLNKEDKFKERADRLLSLYPPARMQSDDVVQTSLLRALVTLEKGEIFTSEEHFEKWMFKTMKYTVLAAAFKKKELSTVKHADDDDDEASGDMTDDVASDDNALHSLSSSFPNPEYAAIRQSQKEVIVTLINAIKIGDRVQISIAIQEIQQITKEDGPREYGTEVFGWNTPNAPDEEQTHKPQHKSEPPEDIDHKEAPKETSGTKSKQTKKAKSTTTKAKASSSKKASKPKPKATTSAPKRPAKIKD